MQYSGDGDLPCSLERKEKNRNEVEEIIGASIAC